MPILTSLAASKAVITLITAGAIAAGGGAAAFTSIATTEAPAPTSTASASPSPSSPRVSSPATPTTAVPSTTAVLPATAPGAESPEPSSSAPAAAEPAEDAPGTPAPAPGSSTPPTTHSSPSSHTPAVEPADRDHDGMKEAKDKDAGHGETDHGSKGEDQHDGPRPHRGHPGRRGALSGSQPQGWLRRVYPVAGGAHLPSRCGVARSGRRWSRLGAEQESDEDAVCTIHSGCRH